MVIAVFSGKIANNFFFVSHDFLDTGQDICKGFCGK